MAKNKKNQVAQRRTTVLAHHESRSVDIKMSGPLPDPMSYAAYEQTTPGAGGRILFMAEKEQEHRHQMESLLANAQIEDLCMERSEVLRAQCCAFLVALALLGSGAFLVYSGFPGYGTFVSGATIVGVITAFLGGKKRPPDDSNKE